ncbi:MAG: bifunctional homocysteine S-methyltransferase/methylenetetrahydrofolate reductase [Candidatus Eremiobacteraeota bacterium]|nr:bifunctional homocysteine S-methyltransferase/methylenetetrahydrofolate reductase [Candidatus Eremiobacteraeota bacterium]
MPQSNALTQRWQSGVLVADGAMGTLLIARGAQVASCVEVLNIETPQSVEDIHRDYIAAGAQIIGSNTFAANRLKLAAHELRSRLVEINRAGVLRARDVAAGKAYVAGSVGPLGALMWPFGIVSADEARDVFAEQIAAVASGSPDFLLLETFSSAAELLIALAAAKDVAPHLPALASLSVVEDGKTAGGDPLLSAFLRVLDAGADAVGVNCAVGPQAVYDALAPIAESINAPLSVMPNAGYPHRLDDRTIYESSPAYFAHFARRFVELGASIVGGCCGTTPDHIAAIAQAVSGQARQRPKHTAIAGESTDRKEHATAGQAPSPVATTAFERKLGRQFVMAVEVSPPRGADASESVNAAKLLESAGADAVNISDNPTARLRMSSTALAHLVMRETKLATILHLTCRDRNLLALQSELLGAAALGITGILALTGDPSNVGDFPKATSVFDVTALGLTQIVRDLNQGKDHAGSDIGRPTHFRIGVAVNPTTRTLSAELEKFEQKLRAGADFAVTQPIFDIPSLAPFLRWTAERRFPVLVGVLLLRSHRNAEFLHNEVPGMHVPELVRERLRSAEDQTREGVAITRDILVELARTPGVSGAYIIPQDRYEAAADAMQQASRALSLV